MKLTVGITLIVLVVFGAAAFLLLAPRDVSVLPQVAAGVSGNDGGNTTPSVAVATGTMATTTTSQGSSSPVSVPIPTGSSNDLPSQLPLASPPAVIKGIYLTGWSAGSASKVQSVINLIKNTELNTVVVDIKDYSGYVSYAMDVPAVKESGAEGEIRIARPNAMLKAFHDNGIYVIGRITDFQDPILAKSHPEWAMKNKTTGAVWTDNNGLAWMDPAAKPVWDYLASIAKDGFDRGFDEIQFDYIRFASDGMLGNISYPYWDQKTPRATMIANYFKFLRESFPGKKISADLFGLATVNNDDLGIGQVIQSAYQYFDYVSPMVYPSHYATGFLGYKNPAKYPYEVIKYSLDHAITKLFAMSTPPANEGSTASSSVKTPSSPFDLGYIPPTKLRPWLQDFEIGGVPYTAAMIREEMQATQDAMNSATSSQYYNGWLLWNASNNYTAGALNAE